MPRLITAVIPTYNRASYFRETVDSVLTQRDVEVQVVIVDDGSTDETPAIVERCAPQWGERVSYLRQENAERSRARNCGLLRAQGEFVAFLDSDDIWRPHHASLCIHALEAHPEAIAAYGEFGYISASGQVIRERVARPARSRRAFERDLCLRRLILHPSEVVLRRCSLPSDAPFDPDIPSGEDWLLWITLAQRGSFTRVGEATVWMRIHPSGTWGNAEYFSQNLLRATEKVLATGLPRERGIASARMRALTRVSCAYAWYLAGQKRPAWEHLAAGLRTYPWVVRDADFWRVVSRLPVGTSLARRIRHARHQGRRLRSEGVAQ